MGEHRLAIMGDKDPAGFGRDSERLRVGDAYRAAIVRAHKIDKRFPPLEANHDFMVEIGVRLKPRPHAVGVCALRRASSSFA